MKHELNAKSIFNPTSNNTSAAPLAPATCGGRLPPAAEEDALRYLDGVVARARIGDPAALATIAVFFRPVLLRHARKVMGPYAQDAKDVVQDVFVTLASGRRTPVPEGTSAVAWLIGLTRDAAREYRDRRDRDWGKEGDGPG